LEYNVFSSRFEKRMELDVINGGDKSPTHAIEADLDNLYAGVKM